jgi:hypothetical protein
MRRIPREPEITSPQYLAMYHTNYWRKLTRQKPDRSYRAKCVLCGREGILGWDLLHRGATRRTNLLCHPCNAPEDAV